MTKTILLITTLIAFLSISCEKRPRQETALITEATKELITASSTGENGEELRLVFNNTTGTVTLDFNGEMIELFAEKAASGIWYKNAQYEWRGKGNDIELRKDGRIVFTHKDDLVTSSLKDKEGQTLTMTFNNATNRATIYLNGGDQIDLVGQRPASGIWYKNAQYEWRGKGEKVELTKNGKMVFRN